MFLYCIDIASTSVLTICFSIYFSKQQISGGGLHHSGIQIGNTEYAFGGGSQNGAGVWHQKPRLIPTNLADEGKVPMYSRSHEIGICKISPKQLKSLVQQLQQEYPTSRYSLLKCNCNHFTRDVCHRLGFPAPELDYLNKAANAGESIMNFGIGLLNAFGSAMESSNNEQSIVGNSNRATRSSSSGPDIEIVE